MANITPPKPLSAFDPSVFKTENRIHVQDSSVFTNDHHLVLNPRELKPENEPKLVAKLLKHYAIPHPHFLSASGRQSIAFHLASLLPVPLDAKTQAVQKMLEEIRNEQTTHEDTALAKLAGRHQSPFDALIRAHTEKQESNPIFDAVVKQASAIYLLVNEALRMRGYPQEAAGYIRYPWTPDQALSELSGKLGISPREFAEVARVKGFDGVAARLGVPESTSKAIQTVVELASQNHFSDNLIENWNVGRMQAGADKMSVEDQISAGLQARIAQAIQSYRQTRNGSYEIPADAQVMEDKVVAALRELPPELSEMLYVTGTEFAYTPYPDVGKLDPSSPALGYHRFVPFELGSHHGTRQIFVAARGNEREFEEVLTHEAHHAMFPMRFAPDERKQIDSLIQQGAQRLNGERGLRNLCMAWKAAATESQRAAVEAEIDETFSRQGLSLKQALGGQSMHTLYWMVDDAWQNLDPNSSNRTRSYHAPESRVAELISRYSELKYVRLRDNPAMLDFIAPEMGEIYNNHYLPHLRAQLAEMKQEQQTLPEVWRNQALPTKGMSPQHVQALLHQEAPAEQTATPTVHVDAAQAVLQPNEPEHAEAILADPLRQDRTREQFVAKLMAEQNAGGLEQRQR